MGHGFNFNFTQKSLDKTNTKEARKKREDAKAFGDKVMGRKIPDSKVGNCKLNRKEGNKKGGEGLARV